MEDGLRCKVGSKAVIHKLPITTSGNFTDSVKTELLENARIDPKLENGNESQRDTTTNNVQSTTSKSIPFCI